MKLEQKITDNVREKLALAIQDALGQEVLAVGQIDAFGSVSEIRVAARGDFSSVPALRPFMNKGDIVLHNHPNGDLRPSGADLQIASELGNEGIGFYIVNNAVTSLYAVAEPYVLKDNTRIDAERLAGILAPEGTLGREYSFYEYRESQIAMLDAVAEGFNTDKIVAVEAGTGVGKSLAYLLPAFEWAAVNEERVVISTATINLQQQLIDKDIPLVQELLSQNIKTALVKGRANYLCIRRLEEALEENVLFREENDEFQTINEWAESTKTGSKSDLFFLPEEGTWTRICSEADTCLGIRCAHRMDCFVLRARKEASSAQILVANHHLLFSDLAMRNSGAGYENTAVMPPSQRLIFDEAHNIEKNATSFFSESLNRFTVYRRLSELLRERKGRRMGLIVRIEPMVANGNLLELLQKNIAEVRTAVDALDRGACDAVTERTLRITERTSPDMHVLSAMKEFRISIVDLINSLKSIEEDFDDVDIESDPVIELRLNMRRLTSLAHVADMFIRFNEIPDNVVWIEKKRTLKGELFASFVITPIDISTMMRESVYDNYPTVVFTSATLTISGSFSFWAGRIGLTGYSNNRFTYHSFPSPFPYETRVLLAVPQDAPEPTEPAYQPFITSFMGDVLEITEGKGLVLFTSYKMLSETFPEVQGRLAKIGITVMKQGDDDRSRLLNKFNADVASVLMATDSFWEGVDAPGESLQIVIICRLPFKVPSEPIVEARLEAIVKRNGDSFLELSLPEAVTRLKQGFGRLMRRYADKGIVLIMDPRIVRKQYGALFLNSLPPTITSLKESRSIAIDIENFLYS